jgi:hypothetical protein
MLHLGGVDPIVKPPTTLGGEIIYGEGCALLGSVFLLWIFFGFIFAVGRIGS